MALIECNQLKKSYRHKNALNELTLSFEAGQVVGLFGPNGSGKSTFLKILAGAVTNYKGTVTIDGNRPGEKTKGIVSYLPERTYLSDHMTPKHAIRLFSDFYTDFDKARAQNLLDVFQIDPKASMKTFSKGVREKLQISLVMSRNASVYLLDEPLGGIDPLSRHDILNELIANYSPDALTIVTTHLISEMETIFDRAVFLHQGNIVLDDDAEKLRTERGKSLNDLFLEVCR